MKLYTVTMQAIVDVVVLAEDEEHARDMGYEHVDEDLDAMYGDPWECETVSPIEISDDLPAGWWPIDHPYTPHYLEGEWKDADGATVREILDLIEEIESRMTDADLERAGQTNLLENEL